MLSESSETERNIIVLFTLSSKTENTNLWWQKSESHFFWGQVWKDLLEKGMKDLSGMMKIFNILLWVVGNEYIQLSKLLN